MGRAMERVVAVSRECGYFDGVPPLLGPDPFDRIPRAKVLALATGSQGEPRAALARIAEEEHPNASLASGDLVIFSSRTIPGNEKAVGKIINGLVTQGVEVVTDRTQLVHVSGHPRRAELAKMYAWLKPKIAVPAHGEPLHLSEHIAFAKAQGVGQVVRAFNGDVVRLVDGDARVVGRLDHGRLYKDGEILLAGGRRLRQPAPQAFLRRHRFDRDRPDRQGRDGGRSGRPDRRPAQERRARARASTKSSIPRSSRPSRACRAASGATPTSSAARSNAPCATPSTPPGARSRRCTC